MMEREVDPSTRLIEVRRGGGDVILRCVGVPAVSQDTEDEIKRAIDQFLDDCQTMIIWYAGIERLQEDIHRHLSETIPHDKPFTLSNLYPDGEQRVLVQVPGTTAIDVFSRGGAFELAYTKAFVVFAYHTWENGIRPRIASALKIETREVKSDLMGEWSHLRHWVVKGGENSKAKMFAKAENLVRALGLREDEPVLTPDMAFFLMEHLNRMRVDVDPNSLGFGLGTAPIPPEVIAQIVETMEPGTAFGPPIMAWESHLAVDIIIDDSSGTIHMVDCDQRAEELGDRRLLRLGTLGFARAVVDCLGKEERLCEHCTGRPAQGEPAVPPGDDNSR